LLKKIVLKSEETKEEINLYNPKGIKLLDIMQVNFNILKGKNNQSLDFKIINNLLAEKWMYFISDIMNIVNGNLD